ncbi:MAG: tetratricopeptide repeat protein [Paludibacteraceae bacterium]|nr:tetratricopeptide repeat protein [Paludibacteraceae bacterium]
MNVLRKSLILTLLIIAVHSVAAQSKFTDEALFANYLSGKMDLWGKYLASTDQQKNLTGDELARAVNYDYGYIAWLIDEKRRDEALYRMEIYEDRIEKLSQDEDVDEADVYVYRASLAAFKWLLNKLKLNYARQAINFTDKAITENPTNPRALSLLGNAQFNNPFGSNKDAAKTLLKGIEMFEKYGESEHNWNYTATRLSLVQCYEKLGQTDKAIKYAQQILKENPDFLYLRNVYLPKLMSK